MIEKYEDLLQNMKEDFLIHEHEASAVKAALQWLDENPELAPGRTITEGKMSKAFGPEYVLWARMCLARIGFTVVPDPEPSNADRLADFVRQLSRTVMSAEECGKWLDERGVKAPGASDD